MGVIKQRGFFVDTETGECSKEPVFEKDTKNIRQECFHTTGKKTRFENPLLETINNIYSTNQIEKILNKKLKIFVNSFNVSSEIKKKIENYVVTKKPKNTTDLMVLIFESVYKNNFPITTKELRNALDKNIVRNRKKIKKIAGMPKRDYSWYIVRLLSNIDFLSQEEQQRLYNIIKKNYDKLSPKLKLYSCAFISTLTYLTMRGNYPKSRLRENDFETNISTVTYHREKLRELKIQYPFCQNRGE